jgi:hypothetical protein
MCVRLSDVPNKQRLEEVYKDWTDYQDVSMQTSKVSRHRALIPAGEERNGGEECHRPGGRGKEIEGAKEEGLL